MKKIHFIIFLAFLTGSLGSWAAGGSTPTEQLITTARTGTPQQFQVLFNGLPWNYTPSYKELCSIVKAARQAGNTNLFKFLTQGGNVTINQQREEVPPLLGRELIEAVAACNTRVLHELCSLDMQPDGRTAHEVFEGAIEQNNLGLLRRLVDNDLYEPAANSPGPTPLRSAAYSKRIDAVSLLLRNCIITEAELKNEVEFLERGIEEGIDKRTSMILACLLIPLFIAHPQLIVEEKELVVLSVIGSLFLGFIAIHMMREHRAVWRAANDPSESLYQILARMGMRLIATDNILPYIPGPHRERKTVLEECLRDLPTVLSDLVLEFES